MTDKKKPINPIPNGVWESSRPSTGDKKAGAATESTDLQGNGYPEKKNTERSKR